MPRPPRRTQPGAYGLAVLWEQVKKLPRQSALGTWYQLFLLAWKRVLDAPLTSVLTIATTTVALLLFGAFVLFLENVSNALLLPQDAFHVSVYLKDSVNADTARALKKELERDVDVRKVELRTKEQALEQFKRSLGQYSSLVEGFDDDSPLPASLEVTFKGAEGAEQVVREFKERMNARPEVETVQYSEGMLAQVVVFMRIFKTGAFSAILFTFLMTAFIIANTIKLALYAYREEVQIMKLLGAKNWYVRAPFVMEGCLQGLVGALLSLLLVYGVYAGLYGIVVDSPLLSFFVPRFHFLSYPSTALVLVTGVGVGAAGSLFAVRQNTPDAS